MPTIPHYPVLLPTLLVAFAGSISQAQDSQSSDPKSTKTQQHQRIEVLVESLPRMGTNQTPIQPTEAGNSSPHQTGLTGGQDWMKVVNNTVGEVAPPSALAEGSFVLSRTGRLVPAPNDRLIFVPDPEHRLPGEGPVLLLPCATLDRLESIWANQHVTLSGEILTYHGRNHLLISDFTLGMVPMHIVENPEAVPDPESGQDPVDEAESADDPDADPEAFEGLDEDPDVLELLRELDAEHPGQVDEQRMLPTDPDAQGSNQLQISPPSIAPGLREGSLLVRRPARLDRAPDGSWMAVFDNDEAESSDGIELTIIPCALLMSMENQAIAYGDSTRFVVSGRLYIHHDRGYLLPTFYQRLRSSDIKPWQ